MGFRLVIGLTVLAAALWSGWWFVGSRGQEAAFAAWFEDRRRAGWLAEYEALEVAGFPNRFDTVFTAPQLADPRAGWAWSAPWLRLYMLSYRPNHAIAELPSEQRLTVHGETIEVLSETMRASLRLEADTDLALERLSAEIAGLELSARTGWRAAAPAAAAHLTLADPALAPAHSYDVHLSASDAELPVPLVRALDSSGRLSTTVDALLIEGRVTFDAPLDRHAVEDGRLAMRAFSLSTGRLAWGDLRLSGRGLVEIGADGYPVGEIDLVAQGWRRMVEIAAAGGALDPEAVDALIIALELVAMVTSGDRREIETTLSLADGKVRIGPVAVADAPRFVPPR